MTINDAYNKGKKLLQQSNIVNPSLESEILLLHVLNIDKKQFILYRKQSKIPFLKLLKFLFLIKKRQKGKNLFHLIKKVNFYGLDLIVDKNVLIPRPETEELVEILLKKMDQNKKYSILEIGTGSGCIPAVIAKNHGNIRIDAIEKNKKALKIAKKNLQLHYIGNQKVNLLNIDIFKFNSSKKYDIIISNPPYIASDETKILLKNKTVSDPYISLNGGTDGLDFYRLFKNICIKNLNKRGFMIFEHGMGQRSKILEIFNDEIFNIEFYNDMSDIDRVIIVKRKL
ncbi:MAG: peptide chain release factor N(5)-glutamine methyltransferase [Spirochaetes bacterium]|nr:peptide chain release factor N(5)-glutamine methyltransferase [Spirochaetota bacterium]